MRSAISLEIRIADKVRSYGSRKHGRKRTLSAIGLNAPAGHSGGTDGPLSRLRERAGVRVLLTPTAGVIRRIADRVLLRCPTRAIPM